jgi:hypothetical protein
VPYIETWPENEAQAPFGPGSEPLARPWLTLRKVNPGRREAATQSVQVVERHAVGGVAVTPADPSRGNRRSRARAEADALFAPDRIANCVARLSDTITINTLTGSSRVASVLGRVLAPIAEHLIGNVIPNTQQGPMSTSSQYDLLRTLANFNKVHREFDPAVSDALFVFSTAEQDGTCGSGFYRQGENPMNDMRDMPGVERYVDGLYWAAETGKMLIRRYDAAVRERVFVEIPLGSPEARFALDLFTRERGWALFRRGVRDVKFTPVGTPWPPQPSKDHKPAYLISAWNPHIGETKIETSAALFLEAIIAVVDDALRCEEASAGQCPVIAFVGCRAREYATFKEVYQAPFIKRIGWFPRDQIECFVMREPTVKIAPVVTDLFSFTDTRALPNASSEPAPERQDNPEPPEPEEPSASGKSVPRNCVNWG